MVHFPTARIHHHRTARPAIRQRECCDKRAATIASGNHRHHLFTSGDPITCEHSSVPQCILPRPRPRTEMSDDNLAPDELGQTHTDTPVSQTKSGIPAGGGGDRGHAPTGLAEEPSKSGLATKATTTTTTISDDDDGHEHQHERGVKGLPWRTTTDTTTTTRGSTDDGHPPSAPLSSSAVTPSSAIASSPTAAAGTTPQFVAPSSYLRPLSRASPSGSGSGSNSRPTTRDRQMTPLDREQIEGLVSRLSLF